MALTVQNKRPRSGSKEGYQQALRRLQVKQRAIAELISGRLQLLEAAARFQEVEGGMGGEDEGEQLCRAVIGWAHLALSDRPERAEAFSEQLEKELQRHLTGHGVRLPQAL